ncbi:MAG: Ryanodine receptor Ryr [Planctomycetes bacterium]|nr:Ryanodine receptor Ryr [Planctomycetota bacterium]
MTYEPTPIDTSAIQLPPRVEALTEKLAENTHENWSAGRIREGWKFGSKRDDDQKTHPCLVPYDDLSDSEKEYDRTSALETLKVILALGYRISSPDEV